MAEAGKRVIGTSFCALSKISHPEVSKLIANAHDLVWLAICRISVAIATTRWAQGYDSSDADGKLAEAAKRRRALDPVWCVLRVWAASTGKGLSPG